MRYKKQLAVPTPLREDILKSYHDGQGGAHFAFDKTYQAIRLKYHWEHMYTDIEKYTKSCDPCQKATRHYNHKKAPLQPFPIDEPWSRLHMDILGPLTPTPEGHKYILLVVDAGTGWVEGWPLVTQDAKTVAKLLFEEIICRYGAPDCIISDCGANFLSATVQALCEYFNITRHTTTAYHPACNGRCEVLNQSLGKSLRAYCAEKQNKWATYLPGILLGMRQTVNASSKYAPYTLLFGRTIRLPIDCALIPKDTAPKPIQQYVEDLNEQMQVTREIGKQNMEHAKQVQKEYHDKTAAIPEYKIGQKVLLKNFKTPKGLSKKLSPKYTGPFEVIAYGPNYTYKLKRLSDNKVLQRFTNQDNIKPYNEAETNKPPNRDQGGSTHNTQDAPDPAQPNAQADHTQPQNQNNTKQPVEANREVPKQPAKGKQNARQNYTQRTQPANGKQKANQNYTQRPQQAKSKQHENQNHRQHTQQMKNIQNAQQNYAQRAQSTKVEQQARQHRTQQAQSNNQCTADAKSNNNSNSNQNKGPQPNSGTAPRQNTPETQGYEHSFERILTGKRIDGRQMYKVKWSTGGTSFVHESDINPNYLYEYLKTHTRTGARRKAKKSKFKYMKQYQAQQ